MAGRTTKRRIHSTSAPRRIRFAVIGLGHIAQAAVLPGFRHAKHCELAALISDSPEKLRELGRRYKIGAVRGYDELAACLAEERIDAVYIATPNSEHRPFAIDAARAGCHVLCEKPLGVTERECRDIIDACDRAGVKLMTAYRLHFEAANLAAIKAIRSGKIGEPRLFSSVFSFQVKDPQNIRLRADLGGGPLHDIGIYCINAARSVFAAEPVQVHAWSARSGDARFKEVEETVVAQLRFPGDRIAQFACSFGLATAGWLQVLGTRGDVCLDPAYEYAEGLGLTITVNEKSRTSTFAKRDQFGAQIDYFARCIQDDRDPEPSGREGMADVRVINALMASLDRGRPLDVRPVVHVRHPRPSQQIDRPPVRREPELVGARAASA
jgi:predicted dehydrogenase